MNKLLLTIFTSLIILYSCSTGEIISGKTTTTADGRRLIKNGNELISIKYYTDYWFHELDKEHTLNYDEDFIRSIYKNKNAELLYTAHTTVEPYCSTIGVLYKTAHWRQLLKVLLTFYKTN